MPVMHTYKVRVVTEYAVYAQDGRMGDSLTQVESKAQGGLRTDTIDFTASDPGPRVRSAEIISMEITR